MPGTVFKYGDAGGYICAAKENKKKEDKGMQRETERVAG